MKGNNHNIEQLLRSNLKSIENKARLPRSIILTNKVSVSRPFFSKHKKGLVLASSFFLLIAFISFMPQTKALYQSWFNGPEIDSGLKMAEEQGEIQTPNLSFTDNGITLVLQAVVVDTTRTVLLVSLKGAVTDVLEMDNITLLDDKGKSYHLQSMNSSGHLEFKPFDSHVKEAILRISSIKGSEGDWAIHFPVKQTDNRTISPNHKVAIGDGHELIIEKINFGLTQTQIDITFNSPYTPIGATLIENGKQLQMVSYDKDSTNPKLGHLSFEPIEGTHPLSLKLDFYNNPSVTINIPLVKGL